jgi:hypothetical protein
MHGSHLVHISQAVRPRQLHSHKKNAGKGDFTVRTGLSKPAVSRGLGGERHHQGGSKGEPHDVVYMPGCGVVSISINELKTRMGNGVLGEGGNGVRVRALEWDGAFKRGDTMTGEQKCVRDVVCTLGRQTNKVKALLPVPHSQ